MSSRPLGLLGKQILHSSPNRALPPHIYESHMGSKHFYAESVKMGTKSRRLKLFFVVLILCLTLYTFMSLTDTDIWEASQNKKVRGHPIDTFTVVINTFNRHDMVEDAIAHYSECGNIDYIHIVWCEKQAPPEKILQRFAKTTPVVMFDLRNDSLNSRFLPLPEGSYSNGVFSVDDDIRVSCRELTLAHEAWRSSQHTLVGFMPRLHLRNQGGEGSYIYRCWWKTWREGTYSIILTKAAFMHHDYFKLYSSVMPEKIRQYVHEKRNCEDIAMQFLVSNHTSLPPIYVKGHLSDLGALGGISTSQNFITAGHMISRSECLGGLTDLFGHMPLVSSHLFVDSARNGWGYAPSTWYEYISSDMWKID